MKSNCSSLITERMPSQQNTTLSRRNLEEHWGSPSNSWGRYRGIANDPAFGFTSKWKHSTSGSKMSLLALERAQVIPSEWPAFISESPAFPQKSRQSSASITEAWWRLIFLKSQYEHSPSTKQLLSLLLGQEHSVSERGQSGYRKVAAFPLNTVVSSVMGMKSLICQCDCVEKVGLHSQLWITLTNEGTWPPLASGAWSSAQRLLTGYHTHLKWWWRLLLFI